jgi:hypothetical protein
MAANPYPPTLKPEDFKDPIDENDLGHPLIAHVARTAEGVSPKHHNHLVSSKFGVMWIQLECGAKKSKSHGGGEPAEGDDTFKYAPGVETVKLKYKIDDPHAKIVTARLELYDRFNTNRLWSRTLEPEEFAHGEHTIDEFNLELKNAEGEVIEDANFPDHVPTAEFSPYKLRLILDGHSRFVNLCAWTYFSVLIHDIVLELGPATVLPAAPTSGTPVPGNHRAVRNELSELPAEGGTKKVFLECNVFKTATAEMYGNVAYTLHETQWGDGPQIPIFAKLRVKKSDDQPTDAPLALGNVRCLWQHTDPNEDTSSVPPTPTLYINDSLNYYRGTTKPAGDNCHVDKGGKRDKDGAKPVFPAQAGYEPKDALDDAKFPFKVEICEKRKWSSFSFPWRSGALAGKTGVIFQPSRIAGDNYTVICALAWERNSEHKLVLDDETLEHPVESAVQVKTGTFTIWKRHHVQKYYKKKGFAAQIPMSGTPSVGDYYEKCHVEMKLGYGAISMMTAGRYNPIISTWRNSMGTNEQHMIDPALDQHATGDCCVNFRDGAEYITALQAERGWSGAQLTHYLNNGGSHLNTVGKYEKHCGNLAYEPLRRVSNEFMHNDLDGVQIFHYIGMHNIGGGGTLNGWAVDLDKGGRQRAGFITCAGPNAYSGNANKLEQTTAHEIGHHLFMPHGIEGVSADAGPDPTAHDAADSNCTMSYNFDQERRWCGLCTLRLRGWSKDQLNSAAASNIKT